MDKVNEYLLHAAECRQMRETALPEHRERLEKMAQTWEQLAEARKRTIASQKRIKSLQSI